MAKNQTSLDNILIGSLNEIARIRKEALADIQKVCKSASGTVDSFRDEVQKILDVEERRVKEALDKRARALK
ncbi:hypothetical protein FDI24_gp213 [Acidovorax phage ACP17]|uniref:Uncharacterized protein n=1 Tax=Acidovorax phage ACP17 TaxID=2010329 RepID=A0A218M365_9CAUD|nr:hypothetical protein FDI24_gp213 [Acidovorax phage ACP17]ASD50494.1 hypothetical protein [Acidovorax phage ACP17]